MGVRAVNITLCLVSDFGIFSKLNHSSVEWLTASQIRVCTHVFIEFPMNHFVLVYIYIYIYIYIYTQDKLISPVT